jgi:predicted secreted protein
MSIRKLPTTLTISAFLFLATGCTQQRKASGPQIIIADATADTSAAATVLNPGDNIILRLPVTAGTGYKWRTANKPSYAWSLMIIDEKIESATTAPAAGASAWQVFKMRATKPGIQPIEFVYDRPFEPEAPPAKRFTLNLEVLKSGF